MSATNTVKTMPLEEVLRGLPEGPHTVHDRVADSSPSSFAADLTPVHDFRFAIYKPCPPFALGELSAVVCSIGDDDRARREAALLAHFREVGPELVEALEKAIKIANDLALLDCEALYTEELDDLSDVLERAKEVQIP